MWIAAWLSFCQSSLHLLVHPPHSYLVHSERQHTEGVRCSSLPLLWTPELRTILLQEQRHVPLTATSLYAPFAPPLIEAVLMQSLTLLSQLGAVHTSVLSLSSLLTLQFCSGTRGLSTAFSPKAPFLGDRLFSRVSYNRTSSNGFKPKEEAFRLDMS